MRLDAAESAGRRALRDVLDQHASDAPVVLGVSGGADSLALAAVAAFVARRDGRRVRAVVVDHGLQEGSAAVADRAAEQVRRLGIDADVVAVDVGGRPGGPEAAARAARREALLAAAGPDGAVVLAHTLDDQAETVLLGLGRGSGARSVAGMKTADGPWLRPFLGLRRSDTERICILHDLSWWDDPHNLDPRYRRVRVRREALPLLEDVLGGGVAEALARTASLVRSDVDLLDALAADVEPADDVPTLVALPPALRSRVLRRLVLAAGATSGELAS
ncbi:MAG: tRNA lysidine(34) synthetase TilS, partial [Actinomycetales bacterium]